MFESLISALEHAVTVLRILNALTGGTLLYTAGVVIVGLVLCANLAMLQRIRDQRLRKMADPGHDPALDRHEAALRRLLRDEAEEG